MTLFHIVSHMKCIIVGEVYMFVVHIDDPFVGLYHVPCSHEGNMQPICCICECASNAATVRAKATSFNANMLVDAGAVHSPSVAHCWYP